MLEGVFSELLDLLIPARCAACGARGDPCCAGCFAVWGGLRHITPAVRTSAPVFALASYRGTARRMVIAYKERGRRDLAPVLGRALADALPELPGTTGTITLVPAPSRRTAARARGGPHVTRLAKTAADVLNQRGHHAEVADILRLRSGVRDAVGLGKDERVANLAGRLEVQPRNIHRAVVLDDIVTTGATAAACVEALEDTGIEVQAVLALLAAG